MMILQSNVTLQGSSKIVRKVADKTSVQSHFYVRSCRLDFKGVPFAQRFRGQLRGRRKLIHRTRHVKWASRRIRVGIKPAVIDLDFVALVDRKFPILRGVLISQYRKTEKHT